MIKKIWKDSVWSKVFAWIIISVLTFIGVMIKSHYDENSFTETFNFLLNYQVKLIYVVLAIVAFLLSRWLYKLIFKKEKGYYSKSQEQLRKSNNMTDTQQGVRHEWTVHFRSDGKPFITDLEFYCTEHGDVPEKFYGLNCSRKGCKNSLLMVDTHKVKNRIESVLINDWNKIK